MPPEVIEEHGDASDWRNIVGTGPFEITDVVEDTSVTWTKNPDYWGFDEKFPDNRLPYVDAIRALIMPDETTRISALRTGKVDYLGWSGDTALKTDQMRALAQTNPELTFLPYAYRSNGTSFAMDLNKEPFDDIRVRKAMQMALDLETINDSYFDGWAKWKPQGLIGDGAVDYFVPFDQWPEAVKQGYGYDPEAAERLLEIENAYAPCPAQYDPAHDHHFSINIGGVIISEASLSFLGFGLPREIPSWGGMLSREGRSYMELAPHLALLPGLCLTITVYSLNMLGDAVRDLLDPRLRGGVGRLDAAGAKSA